MKNNLHAQLDSVEDMTKDSLISIVIPIYNVGEYLTECLDSVKKQTYRNIEILLVDDCSTDNSLDICKSYAEADDRFKVLQTTGNCGAGEARQLGIENTKGDFIGFADGDDILVPEFVETLYQVIKETDCDIVCSQYWFYYENGEKVAPWHISTEKRIINKVDGIRRMVYYDEIGTELWNKLFKRDIIVKHRMKSSHYEDAFILLDYFMSAKRICLYTVPLYYYRQRNGSLMNSTYTPEKEYTHFDLEVRRSLLLFRLGYIDKKFFNKTVKQGIRAIKNFALLDDNHVNSICLVERDVQCLLKKLIHTLRSELKFQRILEAWFLLRFTHFYKVLYKRFTIMFNRKRIAEIKLRYNVTSFQIAHNNN